MSTGHESKRYGKLPVSPNASGVSPRVHAFHTGASTLPEWMVYNEGAGSLCTYTSTCLQNEPGAAYLKNAQCDDILYNKKPMIATLSHANDQSPGGCVHG